MNEILIPMTKEHVYNEEIAKDFSKIFLETECVDETI